MTKLKKYGNNRNSVTGQNTLTYCLCLSVYRGKGWHSLKIVANQPTKSNLKQQKISHYELYRLGNGSGTSTGNPKNSKWCLEIGEGCCDWQGRRVVSDSHTIQSSSRSWEWRAHWTRVQPKGQLFCSVPRACHYLPAKV